MEDSNILITKRNGQIFALANTCSHRGGPLNEGDFEEGTVTCPWHGSCFDLATGDVLGGPTAFPQPRFDTRVRDGRIEVKRAG